MNALVEMFNRAGENCGELLLRSAWQGTLVAIIVLAAVALLRRSSAPLRYGLLLIVLAKFATPALWPAPWSPFSTIAMDKPSVQGATGPGSMTAPNPMESVAPMTPHRKRDPVPSGGRAEPPRESRLPVVANDERAAKPALSADELTPAAKNAVSLRDVVQWSEENAGAEGAQEPRPMSEAPVTAIRPTLRLAAWGLIAQLLGMGAMFAWMVTETVRLRRSLKAAVPASDRHSRQLARFARQLGLRREPRLLVSDACVSPYAAGLWRPVIVLPAGSLGDLRETELRTVLGHELMHIRRGDLWVSLLQLLVRAVWWWHPLVWYLHRQLNAAREDCCDDALLARGWIDEDRYCETLLKVARGAALRRTSAFSVSMAAGHPLARRLRRIMDPTVRRPGRLRRLWGGLLLAAAILVLPGAPLAGPPQSEDQPRPKAGESAAGQTAAAQSETAQTAGDSSDEPAVAEPSIRFVDGQRRPVADVQLAISYVGVFSPRPLKPQIAWSGTTGTDGRPLSSPPTRIDEDEPVHERAFWAYNPDVGIAVMPISNLQSLALPEQLSLDDASSPTLTVLDSDERPAVGTEVRARKIKLHNSSWYHVPDAVSDATVAVVGADGQLQLPLCHGGSVNTIELTTAEGAKESLSLYPTSTSADKAGTDKAGTGKEIAWPDRIVLGKTGRVTGRIRDVAAAELPGMRVLLFSKSMSEKIASDDHQEVSHTRFVDVAVNDDGSFTAAAVPVGPLGGRIYRDHQWLGSVPEGYSVAAAQESSLELDLAEFVAVSFPIVDAENGSPIPDAKVLVSVHGMETSAASVDGAPPVIPLPAGAHHPFSLYLPDSYVPFPPRTLRVAVPDDQAEFTAPAVRVRRSGRLTGRVLQTDGQPAVESNVVASWPPDPQQTYSQPGSFSGDVDENGAFELSVPKDSPLDIRVARRGSTLASHEQVLWESLRGQPLEFTVPPPEKVAIEGRVVDAEGNPVSGVAVHVQRVYSDAVNSFSIRSVFSGETDADGRFQTPVEFPRQAAYRVGLAESETERWQATDVGVRDRDGETVSMEDLQVKPATETQPVAEPPVLSLVPQSPVSLTINVKDSGGAPVESARVVVWSAGNRTRLKTDAAGQTELLVKSAAWVIAGGVEGSDYTGEFVEDPSQPVELRLPPRGEATPRSFAPRPLAEPLQARLMASLAQFTRRVLAQGSESQQQDALRTFARVAPELALEMARELAPDRTEWSHRYLEHLAALRLADDAPHRATEVAAEIEDGRFRAITQAELLRRLPESMQEQQADAAVASAQSISDPGIRLEAFLVVAKQLAASGMDERSDQIIREALPLAAETEADERADYRRGMLAVRLGRIDLAAAERLLPGGDASDRENHTYHKTRAELAEQLIEQDPEAAERFVRQLNRRYRDWYLPRLAYQMASVDLPRAERWAGMMSGPGGKVFAQVAIAAALVERDSAEARRRLLAALDRLESLSGRGWDTGEDDYPLVKVGVTLLPWIVEVAPEQGGDSFWRVLALRDDRAHGSVESRLGPYEPGGGVRTSDPVLAAFVSHFDVELARSLLMPPDETRVGRAQVTPPYFFAGLAAVDPAAALNAIENLPQSTSNEIERLLKTWEEVAAVLSHDGMERWQRLQHSQYRLEFVDIGN